MGRSAKMLYLCNILLILLHFLGSFLKLFYYIFFLKIAFFLDSGSSFNDRSRSSSVDGPIVALFV